jgi:hypothetical protein
MIVGRLSPPVPIADEHDLAPFDCGVQSLNDWLTNAPAHRVPMSFVKAER